MAALPLSPSYKIMGSGIFEEPKVNNETRPKVFQKEAALLRGGEAAAAVVREALAEGALKKAESLARLGQQVAALRAAYRADAKPLGEEEARGGGGYAAQHGVEREGAGRRRRARLAPAMSW